MWNVGTEVKQQAESNGASRQEPGLDTRLSS